MYISGCFLNIEEHKNTHKKKQGEKGRKNKDLVDVHVGLVILLGRIGRG